MLDLNVQARPVPAERQRTAASDCPLIVRLRLPAGLLGSKLMIALRDDRVRNLILLSGAVVVISGSAGAQDRTIPVSPPPAASPQVAVPPPVPAVDISSWEKARPAVPTGNPGYWVTTNDYPSRALREEREGTVAFRVLVKPDGLVGQCAITASSGSPDLDATTCALVSRRAQFKPALDDNGKPTTGTFASRVRWIIPAADPVTSETLAMQKHPMPGQSVITFTVETDGRASNCLLVSGPDPAEFMPWSMPCDYDLVFPVYRNAAGQPVARTVRMALGVSLPGAAKAPAKKKRR